MWEPFQPNSPYDKARLKFRQETAVRHDQSKCGPRRTKGMGTIAQSTETHEQRNEDLHLAL